MKLPQSPPSRPCPVCQVAMHAEETERSLVYECPHCGVIIQIAKSAKLESACR